MSFNMIILQWQETSIHSYTHKIVWENGLQLLHHIILKIFIFYCLQHDPASILGNEHSFWRPSPSPFTHFGHIPSSWRLDVIRSRRSCSLAIFDLSGTGLEARLRDWVKFESCIVIMSSAKLKFEEKHNLESPDQHVTLFLVLTLPLWRSRINRCSFVWCLIMK